MGSSPGFASIPIDQLRPIQTRFPYGSGPEDLSQANDDNSPDHYSIGTPSLLAELRLLVGTRFQGLSLPLRGSFHLSLALLIHYRSLEST
jgi:hypothetical protein